MTDRPRGIANTPGWPTEVYECCRRLRAGLDHLEDLLDAALEDLEGSKSQRGGLGSLGMLGEDLDELERPGSDRERSETVSRRLPGERAIPGL